MAVYRANNRSIFTTNPRFGFQAYEYNNVNSGQKYVETVFTSDGTWTRPNHVSYIEILLVGQGGGGGGGSTSNGNRHGGGAGGGGIVYGKVYVANFNQYRIVIGRGDNYGYGSGGCEYLWGHAGRPTVFAPLNSYTPDYVNSFPAFSIVAPGGGGGGHPCGGRGIWSATQGGSGSSQSSTVPTFGETLNYGAWGKGGAPSTSGVSDPGGGGGSMVNPGNGYDGGAGVTIWGYSNLGTGGNGRGGAQSGGNYGIGGNGGSNGSSGGSGGPGLCVIRYYV
jgi:hypothetical protein